MTSLGKAPSRPQRRQDPGSRRLEEALRISRRRAWRILWNRALRCPNLTDPDQQEGLSHTGPWVPDSSSPPAEAPP